MYCLSVVYISVISFSDTGEGTQQSSPVASRNRFCIWGLRCSLHVERSPRFSCIMSECMLARNDLHTPVTEAVPVTFVGGYEPRGLTRAKSSYGLPEINMEITT